MRQNEKKENGIMAQIDIKTIKKLDKERNNVHEKVFTTYSIFEIDGEKYVQFDTYGKSNREIPGKISQSIQINEESAKYIADMLKKEFNIKE